MGDGPIDGSTDTDASGEAEPPSCPARVGGPPICEPGICEPGICEPPICAPPICDLPICEPGIGDRDCAPAGGALICAPPVLGCAPIGGGATCEPGICEPAIGAFVDSSPIVGALWAAAGGAAAGLIGEATMGLLDGAPCGALGGVKLTGALAGRCGDATPGRVVIAGGALGTYGVLGIGRGPLGCAEACATGAPAGIGGVGGGADGCG